MVILKVIEIDEKTGYTKNLYKCDFCSFIFERKVKKFIAASKKQNGSTAVICTRCKNTIRTWE